MKKWRNNKGSQPWHIAKLRTHHAQKVDAAFLIASLKALSKLSCQYFASVGQHLEEATDGEKMVWKI